MIQANSTNKALLVAQRDTSSLLRHEPCPKCGSSNNLARYESGRAYCYGYGCKYTEYPEDYMYSKDHDAQEKTAYSPGKAKGTAHSQLSVRGEIHAIPNRRITEDTCKRFGYRISEDKREHLAYYFSEGKAVACKVRSKKNGKKTFYAEGDMSSAPLYGQWLFKGGGKNIVVTEGEIDCLTVYQVMGSKWPVVSIPNGAQSAAKAVKNNLMFLEGYDRVVFMFDMDEPGRDASIEVAKLLSPGKAFIADLPAKDPNELLVENRGQAIIQAFWEAKPYRPDGIVDASTLFDKLLQMDQQPSYPSPFPSINQLTGGFRKRELVVLTAGTGVGKSTMIREFAYDLLMNQGLTVGMLMLEESPERTMQGLLGLHLNKPVHLGLNDVDVSEYRQAFDEVTKGNRLHLYDSFGSMDIDVILDKMRYLVVGLGCDFIIFDHLSIAVSGIETNDEQKLTSILVTKLQSFVQETGCGIITICHLKRLAADKGHEDGADISLSHLRGSGAIAQLANIVLAFQKPKKYPHSNFIKAVVLKNRYNGRKGLCGGTETCLQYNHDTGRMSEVPESMMDFSSDDNSSPGTPMEYDL